MRTAHARAPSRFKAALVCLLLLAPVAFAFGSPYEVGVFGGGGLSFAYGSFLDTKSESVAELGASSLTSVGSTDVQLFPAWIGGIYGQMEVLDWLSLEAEITLESDGAARVARTSGDQPFDQYGIYFSSLTIPFRARAGFPLGPGRFQGSLGPFLGIVVGDITVVDRYSSASTKAVITPDFWERFYFGFLGGVGYSMPLGPGIAGIEARADVSLLGMTVSQGGDNGGMSPIGVHLVLSYGLPLGKDTKKK